MNKIFSLVFCILCIFVPLIHTQSILSQNCIKHELPQKFGVLTTTYIRKGSTKMFMDYLRRYAQSDCSAYDNIYIIWNNSQSPEQMGVLVNKDKWKKNVYFMQTVQNSLDFKYIVPEWAQQKVFFSMDDDFDISCETLRKGFKAWQQSSYGEVGPITALYGRSYVFQPQTQSFTYIDQIKLNKQWNYYHFGLTGIAFISRHFFELYYADIFQIREMRKHVIEKFNCQDLLLNFLASYLYPQVAPKYVELQFKSLGIVGVSATSAHKRHRAQCITKFSQIIGYNPVRYVLSRNNEQLMKRKTNLQQNCMVNLKQQHYEKNFIPNRAYYLYIKRITGVDNDFVRKQNQRLNEAKKDIIGFMNQKKQEMRQIGAGGKDIQIDKVPELSNIARKMLEEQEMMMHFGTQQQTDKFLAEFNHIIENSKTKQIIEPTQEQQKTQTNKDLSIFSSKQPELPSPSNSSPKILTQNQSPQSKSAVSEYQIVFYLAILSLIMILIYFVTKYIKSKQRKYLSVPVNNAPIEM